MQIVCQSCGKTGAAADVQVRGTSVFVVCGNCGSEAPLSPPDVAPAGGAADNVRTPSVGAPSPNPDLPPVKCPKCGHRQHDDTACHQCGLVFALVADGSRPWERVPVGKQAAHERARALWDEVMADPRDEARHIALADHCRSSGMPEWSAMRYRHWIADHPDDELARRFLEKSVVDAQALARALAQGDADQFAARARRVRSVVVGILVAMIVIATIVVVRIMSARSPMPF
jgi:hypothetical protein